MMNSRLHIIAPLLALSLFGLGCRIGPRIVRAPAPATPVGTESSVSDAIAYVQLNGGSADVSRDGETVAAVENAEMSSGDRIVVTAGTVSLVYPDAGVSRLETGADVMLVSDSKGGELFTEVRLAAGDIWTRFERLLGADEHFSVAANGVVATVRGTAFGVSVNGSDVDVQVADHEIQIEQEAADGKPRAAVKVVAGEGLRVRADQLATLDVPKLRAIVRKLSNTERAKAGFTFGTKRIQQTQLRKPDAPVRLFRTQIQLTPQLETRLQILRQAIILNTQFGAPTRGLLPTEKASTTIVPSTDGPIIGQ